MMQRMKKEVTTKDGMDEMFVDSGCGYEDEDDAENQEGSDDEITYEYSASARYQPTAEAVSREDVIEIQEQASEVEMIEDVGSLAQSLGASHLGRSLQLQAQIANQKKFGYGNACGQQQGVILGEKPNNDCGASGGIGG